MFGYKVCCNANLTENYLEAQTFRNLVYKYNAIVMVTLEIPDDARIVEVEFSNKMRCDKARVAEIRRIEAVTEDYDEYTRYSLKVTDEKCDVAYSIFKNNDFVYRVGNMVYPDSLDDNPRAKCTNGIHFFRTEDEAILFSQSESFTCLSASFDGLTAVVHHSFWKPFYASSAVTSVNYKDLKNV